MHVWHCCSSKSSILFCDFFSLLEGTPFLFLFFRVRSEICSSSLYGLWIMDTEKFSVLSKIIYFCKNMHHHWLWRFDLSRWLQSMNQLHQQCAKSMSQLLLRQRGGLSAITWGAVQLNTQIILFVLQLGWFLQPLQVHCIATVYQLLDIPLL
jgi:hypothetical protein